jgi:transcription antitermination factor NusG
VTDKGKPTPAFDSKATRKQVTMGYIEKELVFRPATVEPLCFVLRRGLWKTPHPSEEGEAVRETVPSLVRTGQRSGPDPGPEPGHEAAPSLKWFALYTTSRHEKRVAQHLSQRQIECYLPLYRSERRWSDGSRVTLDLPLFPGYLFIHIPRSERGRVLAVPGALSVVGGTGGEPAPLPDATIEALRAGLKLRPAQPHPLMTAGQKVRIRSGALSGFEGVVVRSKNGFRVVLTLEHIMQSYAVEVDLEDLEPLTPGKLTWAAIPEVEASQSRM